MGLTRQEVEVWADETARVHNRVAFIICVHNQVVGFAGLEATKGDVALTGLIGAVGVTNVILALTRAEIRSLVGILNDESTVSGQIFVESLSAHVCVVNVNDSLSVLLAVPDSNVGLRAEFGEWGCGVTIT